MSNKIDYSLYQKIYINILYCNTLVLQSPLHVIWLANQKNINYIFPQFIFKVAQLDTSIYYYYFYYYYYYYYYYYNYGGTLIFPTSKGNE